MSQSVRLIDRLKQFVDQSANMLNLDEDVATDRGMTQIIKSAVMVIGGGEDKVQDRKILKAFVESSGGSQARI
ncbi:MAG: cyanophycinase, partial [Pseudanabaena sp.]